MMQTCSQWPLLALDHKVDKYMLFKRSQQIYKAITVFLTKGFG